MLTRHGISVQLKSSNLIQGILEFSINQFKHETTNLDIILQVNVFSKLGKNTQSTIKANFKPIGSSENLKKAVARMCAKYGLAFSVFITSQDLRNTMKALYRSEKLPTSSNGIKNLVVEYAQEIRELYRAEILKLKIAGQNFQLSLTNRHRFATEILKHLFVFPMPESMESWPVSDSR